MLIFEKSVLGRKGVSLPCGNVPPVPELPADLCRGVPAQLVELSEQDVVRHFVELSRMNYGVDTGFYPLGSCTMKYNPKINEKIGRLPGFTDLHPLLPASAVQGALAVMHRLEQLLCEICGMDAFTLQPLAGAHGEMTGMMLVAAYHANRGNNKTEVLIPDEAHGTNPSSACVSGYTVRSIPTSRDTGELDVDELQALVTEKTAAIMLTNPNTLGIFNRQIATVVEIAHSVDAMVYYDGANLNAVLGRFRPGDAGIDVMHVNLHKTFSTPHGGGGPGAGPVGVRGDLVKFLPVPRIVKNGDLFGLDEDLPETIGHLAPFCGQFLVCLRACAYILSLGREGLMKVSENAVLNANYLMHGLRDAYDLPYNRRCMHEFVVSASRQKDRGVSALDIAKALIDAGFHPPTVYFPLIVREALMIETAETESKETLDRFVAAMLAIADRAAKTPESFANLPVTATVSRPDETRAAREMDIVFKP